MFHLVRRVALACAAAVAVVAVAGCGGGGSSKPVTLPSLTPTTSPSSSPTGTQSELDAVSAVVRRYFALINGATTLQAADELSSIMLGSCGCRRAARSLRDAANSHENYFGAATVTSLVANLDGSDAADVLVHYNYTRGGLKDAQGRVLRSTSPRRNVSLDFRLSRVGARWLISDVQIVSNGTAA